MEKKFETADLGGSPSDEPFNIRTNGKDAAPIGRKGQGRTGVRVSDSNKAQKKGKRQSNVEPDLSKL